MIGLIFGFVWAYVIEAEIYWLLDVKTIGSTISIGYLYHLFIFTNDKRISGKTNINI